MLSLPALDGATSAGHSPDARTNALPSGVSPMTLQGTIGFDGSVVGGHIVHPSDDYILSPLGNNIVVQQRAGARSQTFLRGHHDRVACVAVSKSGKFVASGTQTHMGYKAEIIIWDFASRSELHRVSLHKVKVQAVAFSSNGKYLVSLGGEDDSTVAVWDVATGKAICGAPAINASTGKAKALAFMNRNENCFVTAGEYNLRIWTMDPATRKLSASEATLGTIKRIVISLAVDPSDDIIYAGTTTGDVLLINARTNMFRLSGPKAPLGRGIVTVAVAPNGDVLVGSGDGTLARLSKGNLLQTDMLTLQGGVTSIALANKGSEVYAATDQSNVYCGSTKDLELELVRTAHTFHINSIAFPAGYSDLFVTVSVNDIRVWDAKKSSELLRIMVPNLECSATAVSPDGKSIVSGWSDGKIRAFGPESGKLLYVINDAHTDGVTALAVTHDSGRVISGGRDGVVRVWRISPHSQSLEASMKDHRSTVNSIKVKRNDSEFISASSDGSTIVWNATKYIRSQVFLATTMFMDAAYHPDESQAVTVGTDRKIVYWDCYDGSAIRELEGSGAAINAIEIAADGDSMVTGGADKLVKVWDYDAGEVRQLGIGHSGEITALAVSPDQSFVVTAGSEGGIFIWRFGQAGVH